MLFVLRCGEVDPGVIDIPAIISRVKAVAFGKVHPLITVMNMVSLLVIPLALPFDHDFITHTQKYVPGYTVVKNSGMPWMPWIITSACLLALGWAIYRSKHESPALAAAETDVEISAARPEPTGK